MLFSAKAKGFFVEQNDQGMVLAKTSGMTAPLVVEEVKECGFEEGELLNEIKASFQPKKSSSGYMVSICGVTSGKRVVRRAAMDPKRSADAAYLKELVSSQFRIEEDQYQLAMLEPTDGKPFGSGNSAKKEALFCGMPNVELLAKQQGLLERGFFPERIELSTVAALGALVDYHAFAEIKTPTLVLEIESDQTHSFIISAEGLEASRPIAQGLEGMVPVVQKELGLKDVDSARKLFFSNTFDFTGMGPILIKKLLKELQSSIGFYEVQTGQSIGNLICTVIPPKLAWLEESISSQLGVKVLSADLEPWLQARQITFAQAVPSDFLSLRKMGFFGLMLNHSLKNGAHT